MKRASWRKRLLAATALSSAGLGTVDASIPWKAGKLRVPRLPPTDGDRAEQGHRERIRLPQHGQQHSDTHVGP
jgi:hypothetical protein